MSEESKIESLEQSGATASLPAPYELLSRLSTKRRGVIQPVFEHPRRYVLLTVRALAEELGSDPATTLRIVRGMGFSKYREFQHYLHELSITHTTSLDRMQTHPELAEDVGWADRALEQDIAHLRALRANVEPERLIRLAERLHAANRIMLLGGDLAIGLVHYLAYHLSVIGLLCVKATTPGETVHTARSVRKGDVVLALSFGRGLRQTIEGLKRARSNGAYCVGFTNTLLSPITRYADEYFLASSETESPGESYAAPAALLNLVQMACANVDREHTLALLEDVAEEQRSGYRWYPEE